MMMMMKLIEPDALDLFHVYKIVYRNFCDKNFLNSRIAAVSCSYCLGRSVLFSGLLLCLYVRQLIFIWACACNRSSLACGQPYSFIFFTLPHHHRINHTPMYFNGLF
jgi:hypothetical protein